jgi:hypothetical protein
VKKAALLVAVLAASLALAGSALAFDCIRVSSSFQGLVSSTGNSGHWVLFDMTDPANVYANLSAFGVPLTQSDAQCISDHYVATQQASPSLPLYWALGVGVAGGFSNGPGVLASNNPNTDVLSNLKGIDHLGESPIGAALFGAAAACGFDVGD